MSTPSSEFCYNVGHNAAVCSRTIHPGAICTGGTASTSKLRSSGVLLCPDTRQAQGLPHLEPQSRHSSRCSWSHVPHHTVPDVSVIQSQPGVSTNCMVITQLSTNQRQPCSCRLGPLGTDYATCHTEHCSHSMTPLQAWAAGKWLCHASQPAWYSGLHKALQLRMHVQPI